MNSLVAAVLSGHRRRNPVIWRTVSHQDCHHACRGAAFGCRRSRGITLVEMLVAVSIGAILTLALSGVASQVVATHDLVRAKERVTLQAHYALDRMASAVGRSNRLLLPLADNPGTNWPENIRDQSIPAVAPVGSSTLATAVLALTVPVDQDLDADGFSDADNDRDGKIDEDIPGDATSDGASGIRGIDDDGDGTVDESSTQSADDDEDGSLDEEIAGDGIDNDGDGSVDEDFSSDNNKDGKAGIKNVDDDGDGTVDEGGLSGYTNDDEDGNSDEDWIDPLVFYLRNGNLIQRTPVPWDENASGSVNGQDYVESSLAEHVTRFRVERTAGSTNVEQMVDILLVLTDPTSGESASVRTRVRVGGAL